MKKIILLSLLITTSLISACSSKEQSKNNGTTMNTNDECLICGAPLEYLDNGDSMECEICHNTFFSKTRCKNGHFVCDECHTAGVDSIFYVCLNESSKNPVEILEKLMSMSFCHMHGPEHHILVGSALLTAYKNAGGEIDLEQSLVELSRRAKQVPGGACGQWGACGAAISTGMYVSIVTKATPLTQESWGLSNLMTSKALEKIGAIGGPRCCKRDSYLSILAAIDFTNEHLGVSLEKPTIKCSRNSRNNQCIKSRCPFSPLND